MCVAACGPGSRDTIILFKPPPNTTSACILGSLTFASKWLACTQTRTAMASLAKQYVYHKRLNNVVKIILKENIREYIFSLSLPN